MELLIYHFCPDTLNLYGDSGNIICLKNRCERRGIPVRIEEIKKQDDAISSGCDMFMIGGGSDREQFIATERLSPMIPEIKAWIEDGVSALTICGGYQFLGDYYELKNGDKLKGMGIFPFYTKAGKDRLMTNLLVQSEQFGNIVGFENHSGQTYHDNNTLGKVINGFGNNSESGEEGLHYNNLIGTYLHGPILPKNPRIADYLIEKAYERKTGRKLDPLDDTMEMEANRTVWDRFISSKRKKYKNEAEYSIHAK
ncbi:type 1 glutamine amidotransferase [Heyndrickxia acidicola]|uniref:Lipid II isoglutaminyl synthase (glutamine-hydrolyzing) subunit GatD n=1 Tax=Heyndrickxia acidicola TaxID=209389 RepID=A0ABU6ML75_9BACI|nr:glutamine amidotransferase [Heyndrickxia acidicola]MED1205436.1 glutamine amidotransferase [Heyndrickxia acidicola]